MSSVETRNEDGLPMKHTSGPTAASACEKISYYDASRRIVRLQLRFYAAVEDGDVVAAAVAYARFLRGTLDPFVQVDFWRDVLTKGLAATLEDGLRGAFDAMIDEQLPAEKEAR